MNKESPKAKLSQSQSDKFKAMAKELDCDNSEKAFQVTLQKVAEPRIKERTSSRGKRNG